MAQQYPDRHENDDEPENVIEKVHRDAFASSGAVSPEETSSSWCPKNVSTRADARAVGASYLLLKAHLCGVGMQSLKTAAASGELGPAQDALFFSDPYGLSSTGAGR